MGSFIFNITRRFSKEHKLAFLTAFLSALLIHLYKFANTLPNHDSVYNFYSDQNVLGSGRWALSLACGFSSFYDLPWVIGLFCCLYIALTAMVLITLFQVKNPVVIWLVSCLLAASPSTTETFFFLFTADGYMLSMFLASLAVLCSRIEVTSKQSLFFSSLCICVSCGIYQAYVSFALVTALCYFIYELLQNKHPKETYYRWIRHQVVIYICGLAAYYLIWKLCLFTTGTSANGYQGISEVGSVNVSLLFNGMIQSVKSTLLYFLQWNILEYGLTVYNVLNIIFIIFFFIGLCLGIMRSAILSRKWSFLLLILCLLAIIPFACIWHFVSSSVSYRPMMLQSYTVLFMLCALLYERWSDMLSKNTVGIFLAIVIFHNGLLANISYFYMNLCYERTYADGLEMILKIHEVQDQHTFDTVYFVGSHRNLDVIWETGSLGDNVPANPGQTHILTTLLEENLLTDHVHTILFLNTVFGADLDAATWEQRQALDLCPEITDMTCWPQEGSMLVIDNTLVIKLSE